MHTRKKINKRTGLIQPGEEKALGAPNSNLPTPTQKFSGRHSGSSQWALQLEKADRLSHTKPFFRSDIEAACFKACRITESLISKTSFRLFNQGNQLLSVRDGKNAT